MRILIRAFAFFLACLGTMLVALPVRAQQIQNPLSQARKQGFALHTVLPVKGNVTAQAVLIPSYVAKHIFGGEIANNYAVIELTVTNKSSDAALIIQGIYIDYSDWALSGSVGSANPCKESQDSNSMSQYESCTQPNQVASEEYRVIRGQLQERQPYTKRNLVVGGLTLLGSVLSAYSFAINEQGYQRGISAFSGNVIPAIRAFVPDQTVDEMNRISDVGFRTPMIVAKQGSDIVVCFFPIRRFLSKSFVDLFKKNPAVFFNPFEMLVDKDIMKRFKKKLPPEIVTQFASHKTDLADFMPCYLRLRAATSPLQNEGRESPADELNKKVIESCLKKLRLADQSDQMASLLVMLDTISRMSLNTVRVVIDGVMSVETTSLPAKVESIAIDGQDTDPTLWTDTTTEKIGTIKGAYLTGGTPKIKEADKFGITDINPIAAESNDETLKFSFKLTPQSKIPDGTLLTFFVEKTSRDRNGVDTAIDSAQRTYQVQYAPPKIDSVEFDGEKPGKDFRTDIQKLKTGTIVGAGLAGGVPHITNPEPFIQELKAVQEGSNDKSLKFTLKLKENANVPNQLIFVVQKKIKNSRGAEETLTSKDYKYPTQ